MTPIRIYGGPAGEGASVAPTVRVTSPVIPSRSEESGRGLPSRPPPRFLAVFAARNDKRRLPSHAAQILAARNDNLVPDTGLLRPRRVGVVLLERVGRCFQLRGIVRALIPRHAGPVLSFGRGVAL